MAEKLGSVKRFGPRYGRSSKFKFAKIEQKQKKTYKCPYCNYLGAKQKTIGIWECKKCGAVFTSKAYTIPKKKVSKEMKEEPIEEDIKTIEEMEDESTEEVTKYKEKVEKKEETQPDQPMED